MTAAPPKCLGPKEIPTFSLKSLFHNERCLAPATHVDVFLNRPLCDACAERSRAALRDPNTLGNVLGKRARTEEEIARMIRPLQ
jgi:hypothetical protein